MLAPVFSTLVFFVFVVSETTVFGNDDIKRILNKYRSIDTVSKVLVIETNKKHKEIDQNKWDEIKSLAKAHLYVKDKNKDWSAVFENEVAYIGKNGPGKTKEGDQKTPLGEFNFLKAFGIKPEPEGTILPYIEITDNIYACDGEFSEYYNQIIDKSRVAHECKGHGEHMIEFKPSYNYGLTIDFNKENDPKKGSNIFLHCFGNHPYTGGCVAVNEKKMEYLLKQIDNNCKFCII